MSPIDARLAMIRAEAERDWSEVRRHGERSASVDPRAGESDAAFVALSLDHAYQAFENLLLRLERSLGLRARTGDTWHRALLSDAARPLSGVRPEVVPAAVEADWAQLLGFRHFLRHAYAADLDPDRLARNVERLTHAIAASDPFVRTLLDSVAPL